MSGRPVTPVEDPVVGGEHAELEVVLALVLEFDVDEDQRNGADPAPGRRCSARNKNLGLDFPVENQ